MIESINGGYAVELWLSEDYAGGVQGSVEREVAAAFESARARGRPMPWVEVHEGRATLAGEVGSWMEKVTARRAVMRVAGVTAIDDSGVRVQPEGADVRSDGQLAVMARAALDGDGRVPYGAVRVEVQDGRITLDGVLAHEDERAAAEDAVTPLVGAREVVNKITVPPRPRPPHLFAGIEEGLRRALGRDAKHVRVALNETGFELTGRVSTLELQRVAERAVRRVLGDVPLTLKLH